MTVTSKEQFSLGEVGYTIAVDLTPFYCQEFSFFQASDGSSNSDPVKDGVDLYILSGYINDSDCPDLAYSLNSNILTLFFKTSVYPYLDSTTFEIFGKRASLEILTLEDTMDISDEDIPLFLAYAKREATKLQGKKVPVSISEEIKTMEGKIAT